MNNDQQRLHRKEASCAGVIGGLFLWNHRCTHMCYHVYQMTCINIQWLPEQISQSGFINSLDVEIVLKNHISAIIKSSGRFVSFYTSN